MGKRSFPCIICIALSALHTAELNARCVFPKGQTTAEAAKRLIEMADVVLVAKIAQKQDIATARPEIIEAVSVIKGPKYKYYRMLTPIVSHDGSIIVTNDADGFNGAVGDVIVTAISGANGNYVVRQCAAALLARDGVIDLLMRR